VTSRIPVVFAQGDWDSQTPVENALNIAPFFPNGRLLIAVHGGHGVIGPIARELPLVMGALVEFLQTGSTADIPSRVTLAVPQFAVPDFQAPAKPGRAASALSAPRRRAGRAGDRLAPPRPMIYGWSGPPRYGIGAIMRSSK